MDQLTLAREIFLEYGPIPRVCINFVKDPPALHDHRVKIAREISNLTMDSLFSVVQKGEILDMDLSHSIILLKREDVDNLHGFTIEPVSHFVKQLLKRKLMEVEQKEWLLSDLLRTRVKNRRILASLIFESLAQLQFQQEVSLNLVPMAKVPAPPRGNTEWESQPRSSSPTPQNLVDSAGQGSSSVSVDPANTPFPIRFKPTDTVEYDESKLCGIRADAFYVPTSSNQEAFNSFILVDQVLYIFQFSIAASQEINEGGVMKFFSQPMLKERLQGAEWRFVLVVPPRSTIVFSESNVAMLKGFGDRARLFIGEIDLFK